MRNLIRETKKSTFEGIRGGGEEGLRVEREGKLRGIRKTERARKGNARERMCKRGKAVTEGRSM